MLSYQWDCQETIKRIVNELQARGFRTWFDLHNMKGSTVDSMSDAVDNAAVMLASISLAYKESANCVSTQHKQSAFACCLRPHFDRLLVVTAS